MKKLLLPLSFIAVMFVVSSCGNAGKDVADKVLQKPGSSGATYEMLVVCGNKVWESSIGEQIRNYYNQFDTTINQTEPLYTTPHITQQTFDKNKMFQNHRNVLQVIIDTSNDPKIEKIVNKFSQPQRIFRITVRNEEEFTKLFNEYKSTIYDSFVEAERIRINKFFKQQKDNKMAFFLDEKFGLTLSLPTGFYVAKDATDFVWLWRKTPKVDYGILVYTENYIDTTQLDPRAVIQLRDILTFEHIPGDLPESYMQVVTDKFPVASYATNFNGVYSTELRGLWETREDFMGGPFLHYAIVDEINNRVVHLDAFLYAPGQDKRDELLQLEAILHTLEISEPEK